MKIAVVDTQRAVTETEEGLRAQAKLKKIFDARQKELDKKQNELQKERETIEKQRSVLSRAAFQKRVEKWQRESVQLQSLYVQYNKELQKKQGEETRKIYTGAIRIIRRIAAQEGYDLVIDKQAAPFVRTDLDITDRVITLYNQGAGGKGPASKAPAKKPAKAAPKK